MNEFDEYLVHVDIDTLISTQELQDKNVNINILGIEDRVIIQINNRLFESEHTFALGTDIFFTEDNDSPRDPVFGKTENLYKFFAKTNKVLKMSRVSVTEKSNLEEEENHDDDKEEIRSKDIYATNKTYTEALKMFLDPDRSPPRRNMDT